MAHRRATGAVEADVIAIRLAAAVAHPLRFACSCRRRRRWRYGRQLQQQQQQASGERVMRQPRQLLPERHYPDKYHPLWAIDGGSSLFGINLVCFITLPPRVSKALENPSGDYGGMWRTP